MTFFEKNKNTNPKNSMPKSNRIKNFENFTFFIRLDNTRKIIVKIADRIDWYKEKKLMDIRYSEKINSLVKSK